MSLRNVFDLIIIGCISVILIKQASLKNELNSIVTLMEITSSEATKKITEMSNAELNINDVKVNEIDGRKTGYQNLEVGVSRIGAIKVTEKLKNAFGNGLQIIVNPLPEKELYLAKIGGEEFLVSGDGNYLIHDGTEIPLNEEEYLAFKRSEANQTTQKVDRESSSEGNTQQKQSDDFDKLSYIYGQNDKLPGLTISHQSYAARLSDFKKAKSQAILFEGIEPTREIFVFFDVSCPSCKKFFKMIPKYQQEGFNVHVMLIDKSKKYTSTAAQNMASIYCQADRKKALINLLTNDKQIEGNCEHGNKFLESMTNAALLVGTVGTPSLFTHDAIPIYTYNEKNGKYNPLYNFQNVDKWMSKNGY